MGPDPENLAIMRSTARTGCSDGPNYRFSVLGAGRQQMSLVTLGPSLAAILRVGLEDSVYLGRGELATSSADQVRKICRILKELSLEVATPDEARELLQLKGRDQVSF